MALSNILKEPRRELTETLIGGAVVATLAMADYKFALWLAEVGKDLPGGMPVPVGMFLGAALAIAVVLVAFATHAIGGSDLRDPRQARTRPEAFQGNTHSANPPHLSMTIIALVILISLAGLAILILTVMVAIQNKLINVLTKRVNNHANRVEALESGYTVRTNAALRLAIRDALTWKAADK